MKFKTITVAVLFLSFFFILSNPSCKTPTTSEEGESVRINPAFEMNPPIATSTEIRQLENPKNNKNFLLTATFNRGAINNRLHMIRVDNDSLLLRDDGKEGDEKAGDNVFSVLIQEDPSIIKQEINTMRNKFIEGIRNKIPLVRFINRSPVSTEIISRGVQEFIQSDTSLKRPIKFFPGLFDVFPPDPLLNSRSLMITDLGVVENPSFTFNPCTLAGNPTGAWTFSTLITNMANTPATGVSAVIFTRSFLRNWLTTTPINTDNVSARTNIFNLVIKPWIQKSNPAVPPATITLANWKTFNLDLRFAPFKLLAIVNRLDLRGNSGYGFSNAGEGRFVFGVLNQTCSPLQFTVIFEYGIPKSKCADVKAFAQQWVNLKAMVPGTAPYNAALEIITNQFTGAGLAPGKPNGSALNQIRTNEIALSSPWELRELNIDAATHLLALTTVKKEPIQTFNRNGFPTIAANVNLLRDFINGNEAAVKNNTYDVALTLPPASTPFLGGKAHTRTPGHFSDAVAGQITNDTARHVFSLNTCSGCHGGEGRTVIGNLINDPLGIPHNAFLQIAPKPFGTKATLAAFLTGDPAQPDKMFNVTDPAGRPPVWKFNDLLRRAEDLEGLVIISCKSRVINAARVLSFKPVKMTH